MIQDQHSGSCGQHVLVFKTCLAVISIIVISAVFAQSQTGVLLMDPRGTIIYSENPDTPFVPASIIKLLTSLAAIDRLGTQFHFSTIAAVRKNGDIHIKGMGDPLLISEVLKKYCYQILERTNIVKIRHIILDSSLFDPHIRIPGTGHSLNPYDATSGALCANFNTINFRHDAKLNRFVSAEPQTPLLNEFLPQIKESGLRQGRILLNPEQQKLYSGHLMKYFFEQAGVSVTGNVQEGPFPTQGTPSTQIFLLTSPFTMVQVVEKLLRYSNNFIANQLMLSLAVETYGPPADLTKGVATLKQFAKEKLAWETIKLAEGSGLSRQNQVTPRQMGKLLQTFMPFHHLLKEDEDEYYKTGTLLDVRTRAGYIVGAQKNSIRL